MNSQMILLRMEVRQSSHRPQRPSRSQESGQSSVARNARLELLAGASVRGTHSIRVLIWAHDL